MTFDTSEIIIYQTDGGQTKIDVRMEEETVWLSQAQMAELFQTTKQNVSLHINNAFVAGELEPSATVKEYLTVQSEGGRDVSRNIKYYNLDVIISVGYRVKSLRGTQFRRWALQHQPMYMRDWIVELDDFSKRYGKGMLANAGTVSHQEALAKAEAEYRKYRQKTIDDLSPAERDSLTSIKETQRRLEDRRTED